MAADGGLLPSRSRIETEVEPELVSIDDAGGLFDVLASTMSRAILAALYDEPGTASDLADWVDTSLQNVDYHLGRLQDAGVVEVVDTWYSSKGLEMDVYAPASDPLVLFAGAPDDEPAMTEVVDEFDRATGSSD